ncbi:hypothetical protein EV199_5176 [Pseudobacter ginsenosidimutans]|uniref:Uncharacterized protein n=1 Tax=Pseudobacter ginsenosidimutans TaxID=661488 RepID=A0A4Q7MRD9_9BACT|nr:hypothetical protein EV199_5176 [Pseudobacter ginsenosidimutans]
MTGSVWQSKSKVTIVSLMVELINIFLNASRRHVTTGCKVIRTRQSGIFRKPAIEKNEQVM